MGALSAAGTTRPCRSPRRVIRPPPSATFMTRHTHPQWNAGHPSPRTVYGACIAAQIRSPPRTCDAGDALRVQTASSHRGGRRVHPVRAPQPQYALPRCAKVSVCCVHDEYRLLQRSVQPIRDDTYPCSHSVPVCSRRPAWQCRWTEGSRAMKPAITGEAPMMVELSQLRSQQCRGRQSHQAHDLFQSSSARRENGPTHLAYGRYCDGTPWGC